MISIIIPAHNEASVIARTLQTMTKGAAIGELDIVVVCNGCADNTAQIARNFGPSVRVLQTETAGKTNALNTGDRAALSFPRIYADADVSITIETIRSLAGRLATPGILVVAPTASFDFSGCSWAVRACYDIRALLPSSKEGIGGSGVYALSESGRSRFHEFPALTADDGYVRIQFGKAERATLHEVSSTVFPPRTIKDLIATKTRSHYGSYELAMLYPEGWRGRGESNNRTLLRLFTKPFLWPKLAVYCWVTIVAKRRARQRLLGAPPVWERDNTSRTTA